jgi:hypothetical protein
MRLRSAAWARLNKEVTFPAETVLQFKLSQPSGLSSEDRGPSSDSQQE